MIYSPFNSLPKWLDSYIVFIINPIIDQGGGLLGL